MMEHCRNVQSVKLFIGRSVIGHVDLTSHIQFLTRQSDLCIYVRGKLEKKDARDIFCEYVDNLSVENTVYHHGWYYNICLLRPSKCVLGYKRLQSYLSRHFAVVGYITDYQFFMMNQTSVSSIGLKLNSDILHKDCVVCVVRSKCSNDVTTDAVAVKVSLPRWQSLRLYWYGIKPPESSLLSAQTLRSNFYQQRDQLLKNIELVARSVSTTDEPSNDKNNVYGNCVQTSGPTPNKKRHKSEGTTVLGKSPLWDIINNKVRKRHRTCSNAGSVGGETLERCEVESDKEGSVDKFVEKKEVVQTPVDFNQSKIKVHKDRLSESKKKDSRKHPQKASKHSEKKKKKVCDDSPKKSLKVMLMDKIENSLIGAKKKDREKSEDKTTLREKHQHKSTSKSSKSSRKAVVNNQRDAEQVFSSVLMMSGLAKDVGRIPKKNKPDGEVTSPAVSDYVERFDSSQDSADVLVDNKLNTNLDIVNDSDYYHASLPTERGDNLELLEKINKDLDMKAMIKDALFSGTDKSLFGCHKGQAIPGLGDFQELALLQQMEKKDVPPVQRKIRVTECDLKISFLVHKFSEENFDSSLKTDIRDILYNGLFGTIVCTTMQIECRSLYDCVLSIHSANSSTSSWTKSVFQDGEQMYKITLSKTATSTSGPIISDKLTTNIEVKCSKSDSMNVSNKSVPLKQGADKLLVIPAMHILDDSSDDDDDCDDILRTSEEIVPTTEDLSVYELKQASVEHHTNDAEMKKGDKKADDKPSEVSSHSCIKSETERSKKKEVTSLHEGKHQKSNSKEIKSILEESPSSANRPRKSSSHDKMENRSKSSSSNDEAERRLKRSTSHDESDSKLRKSSSRDVSEITPAKDGSSHKKSDSRARKSSSQDESEHKSGERSPNDKSESRTRKSSSLDECEHKSGKRSLNDKSESRPRKSSSLDECEHKSGKRSTNDESDSQPRKSSSHSEAECGSGKRSPKDEPDSKSRQNSSREKHESKSRKSSPHDDLGSSSRKTSPRDESGSGSRKGRSRVELESKSGNQTKKLGTEASDKRENITEVLQKLAASSEELDVDKSKKSERAEKRRNRQYHPYKKEKHGHHTPHWSFDLAYSDLNELLQNLTENTYKCRGHKPAVVAERRRHHSGRRNGRQGRFSSYSFIRSTVYRTPPREESSSEDEFDLKNIPELKTRAEQADILEEKFQGTVKDEGQFSKEMQIYEKDVNNEKKVSKDKKEKEKMGPPLIVPGGPKTSTYSRIGLNEDGTDDDDELAFGMKNHPTRNMDPKKGHFSYSIALVKQTLNSLKADNARSNKTGTSKNVCSKSTRANTAVKADKDIGKDKKDSVTAKRTQPTNSTTSKTGLKDDSECDSKSLKTKRAAQSINVKDSQTKGRNLDQKVAESGNGNIQNETYVKKKSSNKILSSESEECLDWSDEDETLDQDQHQLNESSDDTPKSKFSTCFVVVDSLEESEIGDMTNRSSLDWDSKNCPVETPSSKTCGDDVGNVKHTDECIADDTIYIKIDERDNSSEENALTGDEVDVGAIEQALQEKFANEDNDEGKTDIVEFKQPDGINVSEDKKDDVGCVIPEVGKRREPETISITKKDVSVLSNSSCKGLSSKPETGFTENLKRPSKDCSLEDAYNGSNVASDSDPSTSVETSCAPTSTCKTNTPVILESLPVTLNSNSVSDLVDASTNNNFVEHTKRNKKEQVDELSTSLTSDIARKKDVDEDVSGLHDNNGGNRKGGLYNETKNADVDGNKLEVRMLSNHIEDGLQARKTTRPVDTESQYSKVGNLIVISNAEDQDDNQYSECKPDASINDEQSVDDNLNAKQTTVGRSPIKYTDNGNDDNYDILNMDISLEEKRLSCESSSVRKELTDVKNNNCPGLNTTTGNDRGSREMVAQNKSPYRNTSKLDDNSVTIIKDLLSEDDNDKVATTDNNDSTPDVPIKQTVVKKDLPIEDSDSLSTCSNSDVSRVGEHASYSNTQVNDYHSSTWVFNGYSGLPQSYLTPNYPNYQYTPTLGLVPRLWQQYQTNYYSGQSDTRMWGSANMLNANQLMVNNGYLSPAWNRSGNINQSQTSSAFAAAPWMLSPGHMTPYMPDRNPNTYFVTQVEPVLKDDDKTSPQELTQDLKLVQNNSKSNEVGNDKLDEHVSQIPPQPSSLLLSNPESLKTLCYRNVIQTSTKCDDKSSISKSNESVCTVTNQSESVIHKNDTETLQALSKRCEIAPLGRYRHKAAIVKHSDTPYICNKIISTGNPENKHREMKSPNVASLKSMCEDALPIYKEHATTPIEDIETSVQEVLSDILSKAENQGASQCKPENHDSNAHTEPERFSYTETSVSTAKDTVHVSVEGENPDIGNSPNLRKSMNQCSDSEDVTDVVESNEHSNPASDDLTNPKEQHVVNKTIVLCEKSRNMVVDMEEELKLFYESIKEIEECAVDNVDPDIPTSIGIGIGDHNKEPVAYNGESNEEASKQSTQDVHYYQDHYSSDTNLQHLEQSTLIDANSVEEPCYTNVLSKSDKSFTNEKIHVDANPDEIDKLSNIFQCSNEKSSDVCSPDPRTDSTAEIKQLDGLRNDEHSADSGIDSEMEVHSINHNIHVKCKRDKEYEDYKRHPGKYFESAEVESCIDKDRENDNTKLVDDDLPDVDNSKLYTETETSIKDSKPIFSCISGEDSHANTMNKSITLANGREVYSSSKAYEQLDTKKFNYVENANEEMSTEIKTTKQTCDIEEQLRLFYACIEENDVCNGVDDSVSDSSGVCVSDDTRCLEQDNKNSNDVDCNDSSMKSNLPSNTYDLPDNYTFLNEKTEQKESVECDVHSLGDCVVDYQESKNSLEDDFEIDDEECGTIAQTVVEKNNADKSISDSSEENVNKNSESNMIEPETKGSFPELLPLCQYFNEDVIVVEGTSQVESSAIVDTDNDLEGNTSDKQANSLNVINMAYSETENDDNVIETTSAETVEFSETITSSVPSLCASSGTISLIQSDSVNEAVIHSSKSEVDEIMRCKWTEHEVCVEDLKQENDGKNAEMVEIETKHSDEVDDSINLANSEVDDTMRYGWTESAVCADGTKNKENSNVLSEVEMRDKMSRESVADFDETTCRDDYLKSRGIIRATDSNSKILNQTKDNRISNTNTEENERSDIKVTCEKKKTKRSIQLEGIQSNQSKCKNQQSKQQNRGLRKALHYKVLMNASLSNTNDCCLKREKRQTSDKEIENKNKYVTQWLFENKTDARLEPSVDLNPEIDSRTSLISPEPDLFDKSSVITLSSGLSVGSPVRSRIGSKSNASDASVISRSRESSFSNSVSSSVYSKDSSLIQRKQYRCRGSGLSVSSSEKDDDDVDDFIMMSAISNEDIRNQKLSRENDSDNHRSRKSRRHRRYRWSKRRSQSPSKPNRSFGKSSKHSENTQKEIKSRTGNSLESSSKHLSRHSSSSKSNKSQCNSSQEKNRQKGLSSSSEKRNKHSAENSDGSETRKCLRRYEESDSPCKNRSDYRIQSKESSLRSPCGNAHRSSFRSPNGTDHRSRQKTNLDQSRNSPGNDLRGGNYDKNSKKNKNSSVILERESRWSRHQFDKRTCIYKTVDDGRTNKSKTKSSENDYVSMAKDTFKNRTMRQKKRVLLLSSLLRTTKMSELVYILQKLVQHSSTCCQWVLTLLSSQLGALDPSQRSLIESLEHEHSCLQIKHSVDSLDSYVVMELKDTNLSEIYIITEPLALEENVRSIIKYCSLDSFLNKYLS